ncbi:RNA polymerase sigma-70 factor, ECF subfamily [Alteromonadaceae bacterium Bs31]|nr:RNA polymerase sigma-70 factor, ECF subfamily [Alteromonadaceae bacterium Bs31]
MSRACTNLGDAFRSTEKRLRAYLSKRLPDNAQVDDVLQDVFLKAIISQQRGRTIENLCGWLHTATRTTLADYYRARKPGEQLDENMPANVEQDMERHQELAACLEPMIEQLPEHYRDALKAHDIEGVKQADLARQQRLSLSAIKSRVSRGRKLLKQQLQLCCHISVQDGLVYDFHKRTTCNCTNQ